MHKSRTTPKPNAGSIADIAFLLLIFFMVVTSFQQEESISMRLPPEYNGPVGKVSEEKTISILINAQNELMLEGDPVELPITENIYGMLRVIAAKGNHAFIHIKIHPLSEYEYYLKTIAEIKKSILELKNSYSIEKFGKPFVQLDKNQVDYLSKKIKIRISESQYEVS